MKTKNILFIVFFIVLLFPLYAIFQVIGLDESVEAENALSEVNFLQISIWISWVFMVSMGIYYKWTQKSDLFFVLTYIFVVAGFILFGIFTDKIIADYEVSIRFGDEYPLATFTAIRNIGAAILFTAFLQLAVFWFTRRWHRR